MKGEPKEERPAAAVEDKPVVVNPTKKLMKYMKKEWHTMFWATIALVLGNMGQLVIPYYIGLFVDNITTRNFDHVYTLAW